MAGVAKAPKDQMNVRKPPETTPGSVKGQMTSMNVLKRLAPKSMAASTYRRLMRLRTLNTIRT
jgi:hypothetical protein